jgi:hypothetical protein
MENFQHSTFGALSENNSCLRLTGFLNEYQGPVVRERPSLPEKGVRR